jgi:hypothetical protein
MVPGTLAGVVLVGALALTACGAGQPASTPAPISSPPAASASASPIDGNGSLVPTNLPENLPDLRNTPKPSGLPVPPDEVFGADVSWPQCPKGMGIPEKPAQGSPMPTDAARFVVLGLTNGPSFTPNPCLRDQVGWVAGRHLRAAAYAVVSYPDAATLAAYGAKGPFPVKTLGGRLANVGHAAALFNLRTMKAAGLRSPVIWVDVEPVPKFGWSTDLQANASVVQGTVRGYLDAGFTVGFYSTPSLWQRVVGDLQVGLAEWRAAGQTSKVEALSRCGPDWSIQGGPAILGQWVEDGRDRNVTCPGTSTTMDRWFHQY